MTEARSKPLSLQELALLNQEIAALVRGRAARIWIGDGGGVGTRCSGSADAAVGSAAA